MMPLSQASARLKISEKTLRHSIQTGLLRGAYKDGSWWMPHDPVRFLENNPAAAFRLPLTADDMSCSHCNHLLPHCIC
ncbi:MAG: hypothetical protein WD535_06405 [Thermaerobacterales bacterium]